VLFLGERPSYEEDRRGEPFVGKTGFEFTDTYLVLAGLPRSEVHIDNAVRCSAYSYDNPTKEEAAACCGTHLTKLLDLVCPQIIVPMGAIACSLWPEINLSLHHGRPMPGKWGEHSFVLWPTFHPSAGIHGTSYMIPLMEDFDGLRKLLVSLDRGTFEWPVDPHPSPDYRVIHSRDDIVEYLEELPVGSNVIACDTESLPNGDPYCVTFSHTPGTGRLIYVEDDPLLTIFRGTVAVGCPHLIFHNYLHDVKIFDRLQIPIRDFTDTMVRAYNLCLGGGGDTEDTESRAGRGSLSLKVLAYRHLNVVMTSFRDTVYPHSIPLMLDWLKEVEETFRPSVPLPTCVCGHLTQHHSTKGKRENSGPCCICDCKRHKKADYRLTDEERKWNLLHRKTKNLVTALENKQLSDEYEELDIDTDDDAYPFVDPWKRIRQWHPHDRQFLADYTAPMPLASIACVPEPELVKYAVRDADTTLRMYLHMKSLRPWLFF
jgi:uracil-DNA glycosylase family 4